MCKYKLLVFEIATDIDGFVSSKAYDNQVLITSLYGRIIDQWFKIYNFCNHTRGDAIGHRKYKYCGAWLLLQTIMYFSLTHANLGLSLLADGSDSNYIKLVSYYEKLGFTKVDEQVEFQHASMQASARYVVEKIRKNLFLKCLHCFCEKTNFA